jgi:hypothetical protein
MPEEKRGWLARVLHNLRSSNNLVTRIHQMDEQNREVRHEMRNIGTRLELIKRLVMNMRDEQPSWRKGVDE